VGYASKAVSSRNSFLQFPSEALVNFDDLRTAGADEVMVVALTPFPDQFVSGHAIAKVNATHHLCPLKHPHGAIDGCEIAVPSGQRGENVPAGHGPTALPQHIKNGLTRAGEFP
jgi:hypothetical protein